MATLLIVAQLFSQAWKLADSLQDVEAQTRLAELRRQSLALPCDRQPHILDQVATLT